MTSTHDGGGKNASMRSRIGIAPNLLLPNCYQPSGKSSPRTPARSVSIDATVPTSPPDVAATHDTAVASPPSFRRSVSVEERHTSPSLQAKSPLFDGYPEPPPEDRELNSRMEMLFEEYRKVERGLIFSDKQSSCQDNSTVGNCSSTYTKQSQTKSSKSSAGGVTETATAGKRVVSRTIGSTRAKSVGNLFTGSSSTSVSSQQPRTDSTVRATSLSSGTSMSMSRGVTATGDPPGGGRPSTTHQRGQSSPGTGRRSVPPPATPPPSRKNAVSSGGVTASRPRQQIGNVAAAPAVAAACSTDVVGRAPTGLHRARSCGGGGMTRLQRRDSLPTSLHEAPLRPRDVGATAAADNSCSTRVDVTKQSKRRSSTPSFSATSGTDHVPRSSDQTRSSSRNDCSGCNTASERRRQTATTNVSDKSRKVSAERRQSASHDRSGRSTNEAAASLPEKERQSRPSTVSPRSLIPRPVSCAGGPPSRRHEDRDTLMTTKWERSDAVLRRYDSGVDVAAAGLSPSDDGVEGNSSLRAVVQRLSASLESCTRALLADNNGRSSACQNKSTTVNAVDDEYY